MNQFFMHKKQDVVNHAIEGALLSTPWHNLSLLEAGTGIRVVTRRDWDKSRVALISGGGSGHEPAHVGFVGEGMLTAAVCGDIFASPSVDAVLTAILSVSGEAGCLLIVKNYTGDRLNFGLAAERAKQLGHQVAMVMVKDDIALPDNPQPRGIAGTALVHKVAGYAAAQGKSLAEVAALAQRAADSVVSIGVAFSTCHLPGEARDERVQAGHCEVGMGIHGEPGVTTLQTQDSVAIVKRLTDQLMQSASGTRQALLVNNLGGFSVLEMGLLTREVLHTPLGENITHLIGPATLVSALDMKGFSLSVMALDAELEAALLSPVQVAGWQPAHALTSLHTAPATLPEASAGVTPSENPATARWVTTITQTLVDLERTLNDLDARVGDGDTGTTFAAGAQAIQAALHNQQLPLDEPAALLRVVGEKLATVMGGSSGVLMSILFTAAGQRLQAGDTLPQALVAGLEQMQYYGGAKPGDRTMIDALDPAFHALARGETLQEAARAAQQGAQATASMNAAKAGRSAYLSEGNLQGVCDPGAYAIAQVFAVLAR
ncbi:dihydroxyacetone kinase [Enterobacterales bacterium CwR94]|nr:dihydroxyacetone kinase [Enterobacterales bacterium CwR94]